MYCSRFCILVILFNTALSALTHMKRESMDKVQIPCENDETCNDEMPGTKCIKNLCVCIGQDDCLNKVASVAVRKLGLSCKTDSDCIIDNSKCIIQNNTQACVCEENTTPSEDGKACLPFSELHMECQEDAQCSRINHSECRHGVCYCKENMKMIFGSCYHNKTLGDDCQTNEDCKAIENSECFENKCVCSKHFIKVEENCLPVANDLKSRCIKDIQCSSNLGNGAACVRNYCTCLETYSFKSETKTCVQHRLLLENCTTDKDCIQTEDDAAYLSCLSNVCRCKSPYLEFENDCVHGTAADVITTKPATFILISLIVLSLHISFYVF